MADRLKLSFALSLTKDDGTPLTEAEMSAASEALQDALIERMKRQDFLALDTVIRGWSAKVELPTEIRLLVGKIAA